MQKKEAYNEIDGVVLTDHAVIRYYERVLDIDLVKFLKEQLITDELIVAIKVCGDEFEHTQGDYRIVVKEGKIVTILPMEKKASIHKKFKNN